MSLFDLFRLRRAAKSAPPTDVGLLPGHSPNANREKGQRPTPENALRYLYRDMWVDPEHRQRVMDIRWMDATDGRVKQIHRKTARTASRGGLVLRVKDGPAWLQREWRNFEQRLGLWRTQKLQSDIRGLMMEGNLALQWVLDADGHVADCVRMPSDTLLPKVGVSGRFDDPRHAYDQIDLAGTSSGQVIAQFALYQLTMCRLDPDNYDDWGALGRPYLDASRGVWKKLGMTEEDLVIRRRTRAPQRMAHVLEGASPEELAEYRAQVEADVAQGNWKDYYANKKGSVTPVAGDADLDQIADVAYLLDTFFAGSPAPKGLFGLGMKDMNRDILEDLKRDYFDEIDAMQDVAAEGYETGFRLELLLQGKNPSAYDFEVAFLERRTDTPNQRADLALKYQALGLSRETVIESTGVDAITERNRLDKQRDDLDPYPEPGMETPTLPGEPALPALPAVRKISVTPGNARKSESALDVSTRRPMP